MRIREITLFTNQLTEQLHFYKNILGFQIIDESSEQFTFQAGFSKITFQKSKENHSYHYCFLIPSNKLQAAIKWLDERLDIIKIEGDRIIQNFESWNADSVYFYDGAGNIAEFIVRYDLENQMTEEGFDVSTILCLNEIGTPTQDILGTNNFLETEIGSKFWKGDFERFGTNGTQEGLFLLVNNEVKKEWFPTQLSIETSPFHGIFQVESNLYALQFKDNKISIFDKKQR